MKIAETAREAVKDYADEDKLLGPHAALAATFTLMAGGLLANAARTGRLPESVGAADVVLVGAATHKLSRVIARDKVTNFIRAPFTRYEGPGNLNEVNQEPRGRGLRRAVGELVACPLCIGVWVAGGLTVGLAYAPRFTRSVASSFASLAVSDFLHVAYARAGTE